MNHAELIARLLAESNLHANELADLLNEATDALERLTAELAALKAEKAEREKQEPAYWIGPSGNLYSGRLFAVQNGEQMVTPLYLAPGAGSVPMTEEEQALLACEIKPRPLAYSLNEYHRAMSEGPLNFTWVDKPHRLVYDLIAAVKYYAKQEPKP